MATTRTNDGRFASHEDAPVSALQQQTSRVPTDVFLIGALGSIGISLGLKLLGRDRDAEFVGHWAPTFLSFALLRKLMEHDRRS